VKESNLKALLESPEGKEAYAKSVDS